MDRPLIFTLAAFGYLLISGAFLAVLSINQTQQSSDEPVDKLLNLED